jgi:hypothetical protein
MAPKMRLANGRRTVSTTVAHGDFEDRGHLGGIRHEVEWRRDQRQHRRHAKAAYDEMIR